MDLSQFEMFYFKDFSTITPRNALNSKKAYLSTLIKGEIALVVNHFAAY
jgi:hypothetical protein